ncbi:hypothetical protein H0H81_006662 [Sphagnurus paluster]|uniref:RRM domain-containing protein n=1 Tax=Sphagnurus paluster TaxID=117069 RepID=A0A9P7FX20_9AGAR|nr:hypothetical protein H0H81_006662 [Sphagnurus paluster]
MRMKDDRRNLYVLGLPFSLTKNEFMNIFSRYGAVTHCVILATVDNSSRRRGFVVMSSHEEAKMAMAALTRTQIKGHCLDISWAVVQRSQGWLVISESVLVLIWFFDSGFLDGGDRALPMEHRPMHDPPSPVPRPDSREAGSANSSSTSISTSENIASLTPSLAPTPTLLATNLPTLLFSQTQDMHPLFYPFGRIKKLNLVETSSEESTAVIVEYESAAIAQEAKENLHGQYYAGHQIAVHFVRSKSAISFNILASDVNTSPEYHNTNTNAPQGLDSSLARQSSLLGPGSSRYGHYGSQHHLRFNNFSPQSTGFRAPHPSSSFNFRPRYLLRPGTAGFGLVNSLQRRIASPTACLKSGEADGKESNWQRSWPSAQPWLRLRLME